MVKRLVCFVFQSFAYLVFLGTLLYAIAFVGGFAVPTRLDGVPHSPLGLALAIDAGLLAVFAVQHSVMARRWFKEWWTQIVPWAIERSTYVLAASLALMLLFWQWRPLGGSVWSVDNATARLVIWTLFAAGWALVLVTTFLINHFDLFGLRQVRSAGVRRHVDPLAVRRPCAKSAAGVRWPHGAGLPSAVNGRDAARRPGVILVHLDDQHPLPVGRQIDSVRHAVWMRRQCRGVAQAEDQATLATWNGADGPQGVPR